MSCGAVVLATRAVLPRLMLAGPISPPRVAAETLKARLLLMLRFSVLCCKALALPTLTVPPLIAIDPERGVLLLRFTWPPETFALLMLAADPIVAIPPLARQRGDTARADVGDGGGPGNVGRGDGRGAVDGGRAAGERGRGKGAGVVVIQRHQPPLTLSDGARKKLLLLTVSAPGLATLGDRNRQAAAGDADGARDAQRRIGEEAAVGDAQRAGTGDGPPPQRPKGCWTRR